MFGGHDVVRPGAARAFLALHRERFGPGEEKEILKNLLRERKKAKGGLRKPQP